MYRVTALVKLQYFYRRDTLQIDAVFRECQTQSPVFKDPAKYVEVNVEDPPYEVTRDHKVVLDEAGRVIGTEPSTNPVQPSPTPNPNQDLIDQLRDLWPDLTASEKAELLRKAVRRLLGE